MKRSVYLVFAAIFPLMVCSGIIYSVLALYILELGATEAIIGLIFATGSATAAFTGPLFGRLSDRFGRKRVLMLSMGIFVIVFLLYSLAESFLDITIIQGLEGIAWGAEGATALALIADIVPSVERGQAMGMYSTVWNLGWIVGPALGGVLAQLVGFRTMFMICSLLILFGLALTILLVKPTTLDESGGQQSSNVEI